MWGPAAWKMVGASSDDLADYVGEALCFNSSSQELAKTLTCVH